MDSRGDANTEFFHTCIERNRKRTSIMGFNIDGIWKEDVVEGIKDFFAINQFSSTGWCIPILSISPKKKLGKDENNFLAKRFTINDEIKTTVQDCLGSKTPGPYGSNFKFTQKFWAVL